MIDAGPDFPNIPVPTKDIVRLGELFHELDASDSEMPVSCPHDRALAIMMNKIQAQGARSL